MDKITDSSGYQPTTLHQLNQKEHKTQCRPSRVPYLNTCIGRLQHEISDITLKMTIITVIEQNSYNKTVLEQNSYKGFMNVDFN